MKNSAILVAIIAATCSSGCDTMRTATRSTDSAEKVLSRLKSCGLELNKDQILLLPGPASWTIELTEGVTAIRHLTPSSADDYCWVQKNKNEPRSCTVEGGWSVTWEQGTSADVAERLSQL